MMTATHFQRPMRAQCLAHLQEFHGQARERHDTLRGEAPDRCFRVTSHVSKIRQDELRENVGIERCYSFDEGQLQMDVREIEGIATT